LKQKMFTISILTMVLVSSVFFSLAAAQEVNNPEPTASVARSPITDDPSSNAADAGLTQDSGQTLYTIQDNSPQREQASPETTNQGDVLIATKTNNDNTLAVGAAVIVLALILGAIGIFYHRKKAVKA
jgi:hypothetical protein